jgi:ribose 5-phosphate isomerase B
MTIYLATDHAGFEMKEKVKEYLKAEGMKVKDCGPESFVATDDYPDYISLAAQAIAKNPKDRAIIFGGSGQGEAMVANRYKGVRATVYYGPEKPLGSVEGEGTESNDPYEIIRLSRSHNDANILSIGARFVGIEEAKEVIKLWLKTPFSNNPRHLRRINKF